MTLIETQPSTSSSSQNSSPERMAGASASGNKGDFLAKTYHDEAGMTASGQPYNGRTEVYSRDQHVATELSRDGRPVSTELTPKATLENPTDIMPAQASDEAPSSSGGNLEHRRTGTDESELSRHFETHDGNSKPKELK